MNIQDQSPAIEIFALEKHFGKTKAVNRIDLVIPRGIVYGLLGPNGAGKTTLVRMLATLLRPDGGSARILGHDLFHEAEEVRSKVSLTGQFASVDEDLTGLENIILLARLYGFSRSDSRKRALDLIQAFDLGEAQDRLVKTYSGGMRRRLDIAASIVITPEILFLDEPTTGLDPHSRNQVWGIIRTLVAHGTTVLLTTQYLEEADQLAKRIAVIDHGRIIAEGTSSELKDKVGSGVLHIKLQNPQDQPKALDLLKDVLTEGSQDQEGEITLTASDDQDAMEILEKLQKAGIRSSQFSMGKPSLDEVFLALTGHPTEQEEP